MGTPETAAPDGCPDAAVNLRGKEVTGTVGVPWTGLSYRQDLTRGDGPQASAQDRPSSGGLWWVFGIAVVVVLAYVFGR